MIPEIGHFALILALSVAVVQGIFPLLGTLSGKTQWFSWSGFFKAFKYAIIIDLVILFGFISVYVIEAPKTDTYINVLMNIPLVVIFSIFLKAIKWLVYFIFAFLLVWLTNLIVSYCSSETKAQWISMAKPAAYGQLFFMLISFACLTYAFVSNDFSVKYVANNSNTQMPTIFRVSAVWGAHEGSLLLWSLILSVWGAAVAFFSKGIPPIMLSRVLSIMGLVAVGFMLFVIITSNPFERLLQIPLEGRQLNPLLQDFGLIIHPPMLYMGYVGLSVAYAFAMAAMIGGKLDASWVRWARPWTNIAWVFLTLGIALGSWWAYYELGWGGWWFWDPVENASLMPWIVGTALIHSLAVTEKRASFKAWTILLSILGFSLSLLGTFLVRSGVLTSVHSFASDPGRGLFILGFLSIVIGSSLVLFAFRAHKLRSVGVFNILSRETGLLINNVILLAITATVLYGTVKPIINDLLNLGKVSVGAPYFNMMTVPMALILLTVMGFGFFLRWKKDTPVRLVKKAVLPLVVSLLIAVIAPMVFATDYTAVTYYELFLKDNLTYTMSLIIILSISLIISFVLMLLEFSHRAIAAFFVGIWLFFVILGKVDLAIIGLFFGSWVSLMALMWLFTNGRSLLKLPLAGWGAVIAHIGLAVTIVGITLVSLYDTEKDVRLESGQSYEMAGYTFTFQGVKDYKGENYRASRATMEVTQDGKRVTTVYPEKRDYGRDAMPMTEAGIDAGFTRDLFIALGEPLGKDAWSFRLYHKPFVRWIWLGGLLMGLGGLLAALDKRYRRMRKIATKPVTETELNTPVKSNSGGITA